MDNRNRAIYYRIKFTWCREYDLKLTKPLILYLQIGSKFNETDDLSYSTASPLAVMDANTEKQEDIPA